MHTAMFPSAKGALHPSLGRISLALFRCLVPRRNGVRRNGVPQPELLWDKYFMTSLAHGADLTVHAGFA